MSAPDGHPDKLAVAVADTRVMVEPAGKVVEPVVEPPSGPLGFAGIVPAQTYSVESASPAGPCTPWGPCEFHEIWVAGALHVGATVATLVSFPVAPSTWRLANVGISVVIHQP